jgi:hypothetical protein
LIIHRSTLYSVTARYDELARVTASRYGPQSQAMMFVHYDGLVALRNELVRHPDSIVISARIADLREQIRTFYHGCDLPSIDTAQVKTVRAGCIFFEGMSIRALLGV